MEKIKPTLAVSACLMGEKVRYNGGHTLDWWITEKLSSYVNIHRFCPEVEMGLGTPRDEISLVYHNNNKQDLMLKSKETGEDLTELAHKTYDRMKKESNHIDVNGYIFMRKSPSCGFYNTMSISHNGKGPVRMLKGLYAKYIETHYPFIPAEDAGRFRNAELKEHFLKSVFAHFRLTQVADKIADLQDFHKRYKYTLMEHSQDNLRLLGKILANQDNNSTRDIKLAYTQLFMQTLAIKATIKNRFNALQHVFGYLKKYLDKDDKQNFIKILDDYKNEHIRYHVPLQLIEFLIKKYKIDYFKETYLFNLYPKELGLQNDI